MDGGDWSEGFSKWWDTIDWGNAPGWVGAVLTSASLFLAISILRRDKKAARQAEAKKLVISERIRMMSDEASIEVLVYNANDHPLPTVALKYWGGLIWHTKYFKTASATFEIPPGWTASVTVPWAFEGDWDSVRRDRNFLLYFVDSQGNEWHRGLRTRSIRSKRLVKIWLKRGRWQRLKDWFKRKGWKPSKKTLSMS